MFNKNHEILTNNKIVFLLLTLLAIVIYHDAVSHDFILYDDQLYLYPIINNESDLFSMIAWAFASNVNSNWHPITVISLIIDYKLYDLNPAGFHVTSISLHIFNSFLVFLIVKLLTNKNIALIVAIVFVIHPLNVETTSWIAERKGILGAFFALTTIFMFMNYELSLRKRFYFIAITSFLLALMSKAVFVTLPFVLVTLDIYFNIIKNKKITFITIRNSLIKVVPFLLVSLVVGLATISAHTQSGALGINTLYPLDVRILKAIATTPIYLKQLIYPIGLYLPYPFYVPSKIEIYSGLFILTIITLASLRYIKSSPTFFLGWFWYIILLLPVSGILQSGHHAHADRYAYLPMIGILIFVAVFISQKVNKLEINKNMMKFVFVLGVIFLSTISLFQHSHWKNSATLFNNTYFNDKTNYLANAIIAKQHISNGEIETGMQYYKQARDSSPTFMDLYASISRALIDKDAYDRATYVLENGMHTISFVEKQKIKKLGYTNRRYIILLQKAQLHLLKKEYKKLIKHIEVSLEYEPNSYKLIFLGGKGHYLLGQFELAEKAFLRSIKINDNYFDTHYYLLKLFVDMNKMDYAKELSNKMLVKFPGKAKEINLLIAKF